MQLKYYCIFFILNFNSINHLVNINLLIIMKQLNLKKNIEYDDHTIILHYLKVFAFLMKSLKLILEEP